MLIERMIYHMEDIAKQFLEKKQWTNLLIYNYCENDDSERGNPLIRRSIEGSFRALSKAEEFYLYGFDYRGCGIVKHLTENAIRCHNRGEEGAEELKSTLGSLSALTARNEDNRVDFLAVNGSMDMIVDLLNEKDPNIDSSTYIGYNKDQSWRYRQTVCTAWELSDQIAEAYRLRNDKKFLSRIAVFVNIIIGVSLLGSFILLGMIFIGGPYSLFTNDLKTFGTHLIYFLFGLFAALFYLFALFWTISCIGKIVNPPPLNHWFASDILLNVAINIHDHPPSLECFRRREVCELLVKHLKHSFTDSLYQSLADTDLIQSAAIIAAIGEHHKHYHRAEVEVERGKLVQLETAVALEALIDKHKTKEDKLIKNCQIALQFVNVTGYFPTNLLIQEKQLGFSIVISKNSH